MAGDLDPFIRKLNTFSRDLDGEGMKQLVNAIGMGAKGDIDKAVSAEIGSDQAMRGWWPGDPVKVAGRYQLTGDAIEVTPGRGRGPMRVLEDGRRAHQAGGQRLKSRYKSKKTGLVTERMTTVKRNVGATAPKNTWSEAVERIVKETPTRAGEAFRKLITRSFGG